MDSVLVAIPLLAGLKVLMLSLLGMNIMPWGTLALSSLANLAKIIQKNCYGGNFIIAKFSQFLPYLSQGVYFTLKLFLP